MRPYTRGLLSTVSLLMRGGKVVAWVGITAATGMGIGLLLPAQTVTATKTAAGAGFKVESRPGEAALELASGESQHKRVQQSSEEDEAELVRRTALRSIVPAVLPSPPLPSRVMPGPFPSSNHAASGDQIRFLPTPPVPSENAARPNSGIR